MMAWGELLDPRSRPSNMEDTGKISFDEFPVRFLHFSSRFLLLCYAVNGRTAKHVSLRRGSSFRGLSAGLIGTGDALTRGYVWNAIVSEGQQIVEEINDPA